MGDRLGVGLIGLGRLAQATHLPALLSMPNAYVAGLCDVQPGRAAGVAAAHGLVAPVESDYEVLLSRPEVEAVVVSVPNAFHAPAVLAALRAGKHVLCEKPPALNAAQAAEMLVAARQARCLLAYGFNNRYRDDVRHLRAFIESGALGEIYYAKAQWLRRRGTPQGWFTDKSIAGGGALIDIGVHVLDLTLHLMGYPRATHVAAATYGVFGYEAPMGVRSWQAADVLEGTAPEPPVFNVEDLATAFIRFENGAVISLESSWALHMGEEEGRDVRIYGARGGAGLAPHLTIHTELAGQLVDVRPVVAQSLVGGHAQEMRAFVAAVQRGETDTLAAEQGLELMRVIDAIYASAAAGVEVVIERPAPAMA